MRLIKFLSYDTHLLEGLTNQTLFFSNIYNFNDPFEGIFRYKIFPDYVKFKEFYLNHFRCIPDRLNYYFENKIEFEKQLNQSFRWRYENNGVCCFSDESNLRDFLMWSNYADKHKGICLVFDTSKLKFENKIIDDTLIGAPTGPHEITYTKKYLDSDPLKKELNQDSFLTTKFDIWVNEKEFRFISPLPGNFVFEGNSLVEVVFGLRSSPESKETIKKIICDKYCDTKFKQIELLKNEFGFILKDIE